MERTPSSFKRLYCDYGLAIKKKIACYIKDRAIAEDVFQDTFLKVWTNMPTYDMGRGGIYSWLNIIAVSKCIDHLEKTKGKLYNSYHDLTGYRLSEPQTQQGPLLSLHEVGSLCTRLSPPLRAIVVSIYFREYTQKETAAILHLPLGTVKTRQRRALELLRKIYLET